MGKRAWAVTGLLALLAVVFAGAAVAGAQRLADASDRKDQAEADLDEVEAASEQALADLAAGQATLDGVEADLADLRRYFSFDTTTAVNQVQAEMQQSGCELARYATRQSTDPPTGQALVDNAAASAAKDHPALGEVEKRWGDFLVVDSVDNEIARCAGEEAAVIEAEREAAREAESRRIEREALDGLGITECPASDPACIESYAPPGSFSCDDPRAIQPDGTLVCAP